jgi:hypothetical protein
VLTIALAVSSLLFCIGFTKGYHATKLYEPPFLLLFYAILIFGFLVIATGGKKYNHLLMWVVPAVCYFFMFKRLIVNLFTIDEIKNNLLKVITLATLTACTFSIIEFVSVNFLGNDLSFIPRGSVEVYKPLAIDNIRARSFMEESGHFSMYWELYTPLCVYWLRNFVMNRAIRYLSYSILLLGIIVSFSAFGYICLILWAFALVFYHIKNAKSVRYFWGVLGIASFLLLLVVIVVPEIYDTLTFIINRKLDPNNFSHSDRESRFEALKYLNGIYLLIGYGPNAAGTLNLDYTFVSFYLGVLMNTGILGLLCFTLFLLQQVKYILKLRNQELRFYFFLSLWFSSMHLMILDNIYVPWFWVMLSLLGAIHFKEKELLRLERKNYEKVI